MLSIDNFSDQCSVLKSFLYLPQLKEHVKELQIDQTEEEYPNQQVKTKRPSKKQVTKMFENVSKTIFKNEEKNKKKITGESDE